MLEERPARVLLGVTSALVTAGLALQLVLTVTAAPGAGFFESTPARVWNFFSFFTVQSNILVAITTGLLSRDLHRSSTIFRVLRLDAVLCIAVTGVVFHLALASLQELTGWDLVADTILHTLSPILAVVGWLVAGPRGQLTGRIVRLSILAPVRVVALRPGARVAGPGSLRQRLLRLSVHERTGPRLRHRPASAARWWPGSSSSSPTARWPPTVACPSRLTGTVSPVQSDPDKRRLGLDTMAAVYGWPEMTDGDGDFFGYTAEHLFAEIWQRPGLSFRDRRLVLIGMLVGRGLHDVVPLQLAGALANEELSPEELREIVILLTHYAGWPDGAKLNSQVEEALARAAKQAPGG